MNSYPTIKRCKSGQPRICVLSQRNIHSLVSRCSIYEFEDIIYEIDDADILSPAPRLLSNRIISRATRRLAGKLTGVPKGPIVEEIQVQQDYDLFIAFCLFITDLRVLKNIKNWKQRSGKTVCWLLELWEHSLGEYEDLLEIMAEFDYVVMNLSGSVQAVQKAIGKPVFYHVPAVDAILFCPYPEPPERSIDIYSMGRRSQVTHEALLEFSVKKGLFYLYDTFENMTSPCMEQHRSLSANLLKRSRYFIANASKMNCQDETKGQIEFGVRFPEGAAGGTIMIGELPANHMFPVHFNWPDAFIPMTFDNPDIGELIADLDSDADRLERARKNNIINCLQRHDWAYRWKDILDIVSIKPTNGLLKRERYLEELAGFVMNGGNKTK